MTNNEETIITDENIAAEETPKKTKLDALKPYAKRVLIWTGAAIGVIAGAALIHQLRPREDEIDVYVFEELPTDTTVDEDPAPVTAD